MLELQRNEYLGLTVCNERAKYLGLWVFSQSQFWFGSLQVGQLSILHVGMKTAVNKPVKGTQGFVSSIEKAVIHGKHLKTTTV